MANPEHVAILLRGPDAWTRWREENSDVQPDLSRADLDGAYISFPKHGATLKGLRRTNHNKLVVNFDAPIDFVPDGFFPNGVFREIPDTHIAGAKVGIDAITEPLIETPVTDEAGIEEFRTSRFRGSFF